jgi:hypothetical protein
MHTMYNVCTCISPGEVPEDLDVLLGRHHPAQAQTRRLQPLGGRADHEQVGLVDVWDVLQSALRVLVVMRKQAGT